MYNGRCGVSTDDNGLYYMRQRYYNPEIKRFVNQDILAGSIGNSRSLNRYSYVQGNPVSYTDPFGLSPLNGLFSGTMLVHAICELVGWIPGPVGAIANIVDGLVYLFVDKDYKNAFYSIGTGLSFGVGKIAGAVGKGSKTALRVQRVCNAVGNGINFLQSAEGIYQTASMMVDKYIVQGQPFDSSTAMEFLFLGANMLGAKKSGSALATDVKDFGRLVKGSWTRSGNDTTSIQLSRRELAERKLADAANGSRAEGVLIGKDGDVPVYQSQLQLKNSITDAGAQYIGPARNNDGQIYHMNTPYGPVEIRIMQQKPGQTNPYLDNRTIIVEQGSVGTGTGVYTYGNGAPIRGAISKSDRKSIGHTHNQMP